MAAPFDTLIENCSEVLTLQGDDRGLGAIADGAVGIVGADVAFVGPRVAVPKDRVGASTEVIDARGGFVGPGFVDAHTHLVFAGERSLEFEQRARGATYLEIAQAGGGIANTMKATRAATVEVLVALARPRARRLLSQGVTTAEVKSGYGLSVDDELKMLRAVQRLANEGPLTLVPTLLAAHALPPEFKDDRAGYVKLCRDQILPAVTKERLARFFDVFCEQSAFTKEETTELCRAATAAGLRVRLHVDQLTAGGGAELAAALGAASADHLEQISDAGIRALASAKVSAVLVPMATFFLKLRKYAPGRALWDAGVNVALGTNLNPGSAMSENLALSLSLAVLQNGLSAAEAYYAATRGAAKSLGLETGQLTAGAPADLVLFACDSYRHLPYHCGINHARTVFKAGNAVHQSADFETALCR